MPIVFILILRNPAAYAQLGFEAWGKSKGLVVYTAGISNKQFRFRDFTSEERSAVTNLDYLSLGFSLGNRLGMGFGIMPFTAVGYNFVDEQESGTEPLTNIFNGQGGLNRVYYSVGYEIVKECEYRSYGEL